MSTISSSILTSLSDLTKNPKLNYYDPHLCKDIHIKLDQAAREQGLSYEERFEMVNQRISSLEFLFSPLGEEESDRFR